MNINAEVRWKSKQPSALLKDLVEQDDRVQQYLFKPEMETPHLLILETGFQTPWGKHLIKSKTVSGCKKILSTIVKCNCGRCN